MVGVFEDDTGTKYANFVEGHWINLVTKEVSSEKPENLIKKTSNVFRGSFNALTEVPECCGAFSLKSTEADLFYYSQYKYYSDLTDGKEVTLEQVVFLNEEQATHFANAQKLREGVYVTGPITAPAEEYLTPRIAAHRIHYYVGKFGPCPAIFDFNDAHERPKLPDHCLAIINPRQYREGFLSSLKILGFVPYFSWMNPNTDSNLLCLRYGSGWEPLNV